MSDVADVLSDIYEEIKDTLEDPNYHPIEEMAPYINRLLFGLDAVRAYYDAVQMPVVYPEWEKLMLEYVQAIFASPNPETVIHPDITPFRERWKTDVESWKATQPKESV